MLLAVAPARDRRRSGYTSGWTDRTIMAVNDALLAFPGILLALAVMIVVGANRFGLDPGARPCLHPLGGPGRARHRAVDPRERICRGLARHWQFRKLYSMVRHVLPNAIAPAAVLATSMFGWVLLAESALSFLGLGVPPPAPTWGNMLASSRPFMEKAAWLSASHRACASR